MVSVNQRMLSVLLEAFSSRHGEWNADNGFVLQGTVTKMDNMLGVVAMASVLRISVARGIREAAEVDIHFTAGNKSGMKAVYVWNQFKVCLQRFS